MPSARLAVGNWISVIQVLVCLPLNYCCPWAIIINCCIDLGLISTVPTRPKTCITLLRFPTANLADGTVEEFHDVKKSFFAA